MWNVFPREVCIYLQFPKCVCSPHLLSWHVCFFFYPSLVLILPSLFSVLIITFCFPPYPQARPLSWTRGINNVSWVWILHLKKKKPIQRFVVQCVCTCLHWPFSYLPAWPRGADNRRWTIMRFLCWTPALSPTSAYQFLEIKTSFNTKNNKPEPISGSACFNNFRPKKGN